MTSGAWWHRQGQGSASQAEPSLSSCVAIMVCACMLFELAVGVTVRLAWCFVCGVVIERCVCTVCPESEVYWVERSSAVRVVAVLLVCGASEYVLCPSRRWVVHCDCHL